MRTNSDTESLPRVMVVDDDQSMRRLMLGVLRGEASLDSFETGLEALQALRDRSFDIVLLDLNLPVMSGYDVCRQIKLLDRGNIPNVIVVSANSSQQEQRLAFEAGADDYLVKPIDVQELKSRVRLHHRLRRAVHEVRDAESEISRHNQRIKRLVDERLQETNATQELALFTLARLVERRDDQTGNHIKRVQEFAQVIARELGRCGPYRNQISPKFLDDLHRSSPLHDIGKIAISDLILQKPGGLTKEEFDIMKTHAVIGGEILDEAISTTSYGGFLKMAADIARHHHERFDGTGYPDQLVGYDIPLSARIVAVADVYDALVSPRPYKRAFSCNKAFDMIVEGSGKHFDPIVIDAFVSSFREIRLVQSETIVSWLCWNRHDISEAKPRSIGPEVMHYVVR